MSTGQLAELIAAGFFAIGVCVACYVLLRLARLITSATEAVAEYRARADSVLAGAQAAVDRASEQLARSDAITASMDDVTSNMAELSGHVSALAGLARGIAGGLSGPLLRVAAVTYGVRRATGRRLTRRARALAGGAGQGLPPALPAAPGRRTAGGPVIRRLFWLLAGALLGVTGYRRATRLARSLRPGSAARPAARAVAAVLGPGLAPARDGVGPFLADVRDGMDEYLDRHAPRTGPTLDAQPAARPPLASPPDPPRGRPQRGRSRFNHAKDGR